MLMSVDVEGELGFSMRCRVVSLLPATKFLVYSVSFRFLSLAFAVNPYPGEQAPERTAHFVAFKTNALTCVSDKAEVKTLLRALVFRMFGGKTEAIPRV